jgi:hypothetical protein
VAPGQRDRQQSPLSEPLSAETVTRAGMPSDPGVAALRALRYTKRMTNTKDPKNTTDTKPSPIEVWLTEATEGMGISARTIHPDETVHYSEVESLSMRGAQREITGDLIRRGYTAVGRWTVERMVNDEPVETSRSFRLAGRVG